MHTTEIRERLMRPWVHGEAAQFRNLTLDEPLDLSGLTLSGVDFQGTRFRGGLTAAGARFEGLSWFGGCQFANADFSGVLFVNDARFENTVFDIEASFQGAEFRGIARFDAALIPVGAFSGMTCYGNASFADMRAGDLDVSESEFLGGVWAQSAVFGAGARFDDSQVHGRLWLRGARRGNAPLRTEDFGLTFGYSWV